MKTIKQRRLELLEDTCRHFNSNNRAVDVSGACSYWLGCAIGRLIPDMELRAKLDKFAEIQDGSVVANDCVFALLPEELKELGQEFLSRLQSLHDITNNWCPGGLTSTGQFVADEIRKEICDAN